MLTLKLRLLSNQYSIFFASLFAIFAFLSLTSKGNFIWIAFALFSLFPLIKKWWMIPISIAIFGIIFLSFYLTRQSNIDQDVNVSSKIIQKLANGYVVKVNNNNVFLKTDLNLEIGDVVQIKGKIVPSAGFLKTYLSEQNIENVFSSPNIKLIGKNEDIRNKMSNYLFSGPSFYKTYAPLMLLGLKTDDSKAIYDLSIKLNVVHLFVISGFHISLFALIFNYLLIKIKVPKQVASILVLIPIAIYLFFLRFPLPATRAGLLYLLAIINRLVFKKKFNNVELVALTMILVSIWKPRQITSLSFVLTFVATFAIVLINEINFSSKLKKTMWLTVGVYFATFPIILSTNNFISVFGIIYGFVLAPVFVVVYVLTMFLFPFKDALNFIYKCFDFALHSFESINLVIPCKFWTMTMNKILFLFLLACPIIYLIWNWYMVKKII